MYYIGIHFGGISIRAGIVSEEGEFILRGAVPTLKYRPLSAIMEDTAKLCLELMKEKSISLEEIEYIGIGCIGTVDDEKGTLAYSSYLNCYNLEIRKELQKHIPLPVYLENDANCFALAEHMWGAGKGKKNTVAVSIGYTIGSGIIIDGKIYQGSFSSAGEVGHQVIVFQGEECNCGRRGCWEAYASASAIARDARIQAVKHTDSEMFKMVNGDIRVISYKIPFEAARRKDVFAMDLIDLYTRYLAVGLINIVNILQPEMIVLGGSMADEIATILEPLRDLISHHTYGNQGRCQTEIVMAKLDEDSDVLGAAMIRK